MDALRDEEKSCNSPKKVFCVVCTILFKRQEGHDFTLLVLVFCDREITAVVMYGNIYIFI